MADTNESTQTQAGAATVQVSDFDALLTKQFNPQTDTAKREVEGAVRTLAQQALASTPLISNDVLLTIEAMIAAIDKKLSAQINAIMHHPDFQQLESAWRGLHYLVSNSETDDMLKIRVLNVGKKDLHKTLKRFKGAAWDQSPLFKKLYEEEYGTLGESLSGVWWATTTSITVPRMWNCWARWPRSRRRLTPPSWRPRRPPCSRWNPGRNSATRVT